MDPFFPKTSAYGRTPKDEVQKIGAKLRRFAERFTVCNCLRLSGQLSQVRLRPCRAPQVGVPSYFGLFRLTVFSRGIAEGTACAGVTVALSRCYLSHNIIIIVPELHYVSSCYVSVLLTIPPTLQVDSKPPVPAGLAPTELASTESIEVESFLPDGVVMGLGKD